MANELAQINLRSFEVFLSWKCSANPFSYSLVSGLTYVPCPFAKTKQFLSGTKNFVSVKKTSFSSEKLQKITSCQYIGIFKL